MKVVYLDKILIKQILFWVNDCFRISCGMDSQPYLALVEYAIVVKQYYHNKVRHN